ncbi:PAN2-PAN3 deadenylation complex subunit PAN3 isoform X1 [Diorhabda sublineata]|uniref:PAN2-PAN3 deadenylation complex subunit PAN3 isoform X1 n=1 Tax=Diorhabda sublineata TaxID=1163346 RepID=UPI0024E11290|nr:PAN2-PAN3 deadenylation complex subunit PAN3 isoform X1 [Diorhabda sublineata]
MDWMSHNHSRSLSSRLDLARATQATEFVPRVISSSTSASPNFFSANTTLHPITKKLEDGNLSSSLISPESSSPPLVNNTSLITSSPVQSDKVASSPSSALPAYQENVGGTTYFYQFHSTPENCQPGENPATVAGSLPSEYNVYTGKKDSSFFLSEDLRNDILNRNVLTLLQPDPQQYPDLPQEVDSYHQLFPLEPISNTLHKAHLGYQATMYKATHTKTGIHYCLRRIHGFRLSNTKCMAYVELWRKLTHSNIVQLKEVFTTKAFGDTSMMFVYDYHPGSETLLTKHFSPDQPGYCDPFLNDSSTPRPYSYQKNNLLRHTQNNKLPEPLIWNYIIQLTSALRVIHSSGLACRSLDPTKIIINSRNRLRLSCLGVMDVVLHEPNSTINHIALVQHYQQEDLTALGKLVLALACKSTMAVQRENISTALDIISRSYTTDLRNLIMYLLATQQRRSVTDLMPMIGARFYTQLDNLHNHIETLDHELSKEVQNGRLFRIMTKLATINERPDFNLESTWAETGDRYMLKLFRDYVFHQVTEDGNPWLDMAHIVQCLNKLDVGVPEKISLVSRDEQSVLVVSYAELKHCLEQSFGELCNSSTNIHDLSRLSGISVGIDEKL